jgi:4'-phosphopantetheinyl transferase
MARPFILRSQPAEPFALPNDEVHVWYASRRCEASEVKKLSEYLDEAERGRAERFHFKEDGQGFIIARGLLRLLLSRYLKLSPERLRFDYNPYGKPAVAADSSGSDIRFNLSHKGGLILYAFCVGREIGIDVEQLRAELDILSIARSYFSDAEVARLGSLPAGMRRRGFFNAWARKEAYIKALGRGLSQPLNQFEVSLAPGEPARLLRAAHDDREVMRWRLLELPVGQEYAAAIAVEGFNWRDKQFVWKRGDVRPLPAEGVATLYFDDCD